MPNDTVDKAIKRGTGELDGMVIEEISYEGYGPGGVAILVECADRQQEPHHGRGAARLHQVQRQPGRQRLRVLHLRPQRPDPAGRIRALDLETVMEAAIEAGAEDVESEDEGITVTTAMDDLHAVAEALREAGLPVVATELVMVPNTYVKVEAGEALGLMKLINHMDDLDDVTRVSANFDIDEALMAEIEEKL